MKMWFTWSYIFQITSPALLILLFYSFFYVSKKDIDLERNKYINMSRYLFSLILDIMNWSWNCCHINTNVSFPLMTWYMNALINSQLYGFSVSKFNIKLMGSIFYFIHVRAELMLILCGFYIYCKYSDKRRSFAESSQTRIYKWKLKTWLDRACSREIMKNTKSLTPPAPASQHYKYWRHWPKTRKILQHRDKTGATF